MSRIAEAAWGDTPLGQYPEAPGFKARATSKDAARSMASQAHILRDKVLAAIREAGARGLTADEAADRLGRTVLAVRPRCSELVAANLIEATEQRRRNASGRSAIVWRAK